MGFRVVVTVPHSEEDFPDIYSIEEYTGEIYLKKEDASKELEEAKNDPKYPEAWVQFQCDNDCYYCEFYNAKYDTCRIDNLVTKSKGGE